MNVLESNAWMLYVNRINSKSVSDLTIALHHLFWIMFEYFSKQNFNELLFKLIENKVSNE